MDGLKAINTFAESDNTFADNENTFAEASSLQGVIQQSKIPVFDDDADALLPCIKITFSFFLKDRLLFFS